MKELVAETGCFWGIMMSNTSVCDSAGLIAVLLFFILFAYHNLMLSSFSVSSFSAGHQHEKGL